MTRKDNPAAKPAPARRGRPEWEPTPKDRRTVETMAAYGIPEEDIALVLGKDAKTLRKHCRVELDTGLIKANAKVAGNMYALATGKGREAVTAGIFWLKTRAGWSEYSPPPKSPAHPPATKPLGKKAQADADAHQPPSEPEWAVLVHGRG